MLLVSTLTTCSATSAESGASTFVSWKSVSADDEILGADVEPHASPDPWRTLALASLWHRD